MTGPSRARARPGATARGHGRTQSRDIRHRRDHQQGGGARTRRRRWPRPVWARAVRTEPSRRLGPTRKKSRSRRGTVCHRHGPSGQAAEAGRPAGKRSSWAGRGRTDGRAGGQIWMDGFRSGRQAGSRVRRRQQLAGGFALLALRCATWVCTWLSHSMSGSPSD